MSRQTPLILCVDDEEEVRNLVQITLETHGFQVRVASNGDEGLTALNEITPDVIVTDIDMPNLDGYHFIDKIRAEEKFATVPILFITGLTSDSKRSDDYWAQRMKVDGFITKPFDPVQLTRKLDALLKRRH